MDAYLRLMRCLFLRCTYRPYLKPYLGCKGVSPLLALSHYSTPPKPENTERGTHESRGGGRVWYTYQHNNNNISMLKVASFEIMDAEGMNTLLQSYRLAPGAHILVSEGKVCIPYEDGEPSPVSHRIIALQELKNTKIAEADIIHQSQLVVSSQVEGLENELGEATANLDEANNQPNSKGKSRAIKNAEERVKAIEGRIMQLKNQYHMNQKELQQIELNVVKFDEMIKQLGN